MTDTAPETAPEAVCDSEMELVPTEPFSVTTMAAHRNGVAHNSLRGAILTTLLLAGALALAHVIFPIVPAILAYLCLGVWAVNVAGLTALRVMEGAHDHRCVMNFGQRMEWRNDVVKAEERAIHEAQVAQWEAAEKLRLANMAAPRVRLQPQAAPLSMSALAAMKTPRPTDA